MSSPDLSGCLTRLFIRSKLTPLLVLLSLALGAISVAVNAKEEDPSITVAMADVFLPFPGRGAAEVDERISRPFSAVVRELTVVEHVMSVASDDGAMLVVQFKAGVPQDLALAALYERLAANGELLPPGAPFPVVKARGVEDVPVLVMSIWDERDDPAVLRRLAGELRASLLQLPGVSRAEILGGSQRTLSVQLDASKLAGRGLAAERVAQAVQAANVRLPSGTVSGPGGVFRVQAGGLVESEADLEALIVGATASGPVYLRDVATVADGVPEARSYVAHFGRESGWSAKSAVTLAVTKAPGVNAGDVNERARALLEDFSARLLPASTHIEITRDAGRAATDRVETLMEHMLLATLIVVMLIAVALGRREALIVAIVIPVTLAIVPFVYWLAGFTLNRITLAAMIFAIGILVDDAIVIIENIHRHFQSGSTLSPMEAAIEAVQEVGNPTILATFAVVGALLPTAFVTGMVGQYLRPLPVGASVAMLFSLVVALTVTPFLALRVLGHEVAPKRVSRRSAYRAALEWIVARPSRRWALHGLGLGLLLTVLAFLPLRVATLQLLPTTDADEMTVMVDLPAGSTLQTSYAASSKVARKLAEVPELEGCQVYAGTAAPLTFQGVARHAMLRQHAHQSEVHLQLKRRESRERSSHEVAASVRALVAQALQDEDATFSVAELPPGPPVQATVVAEIYGPDEATRLELAKEVRAQFARTPGIVDLDWSARSPESPLLSYEVDPQRAALRGIVAGQAALAVRTLLSGDVSGWASLPDEREPVPIALRLTTAQRASRADVEGLTFTSPDGSAVPASDIGTFRVAAGNYPRLRRDLIPMMTVTAETVGTVPVNAVLDLTEALRALRGPDGRPLEFLWTGATPSPSGASIRWAGEWTTTYELFRDLGGAFAIVIFLLYVMMVGWYQSFVTPLVVMLPIPLSLLGVIPAHALFGMPLTGMAVVGFIALAGLMVRNSILLVDFARANIDRGLDVAEATLDAAQTRLRPIVLTGATVVLGDGMLFFDPLLQGLGLAMAFGALASTALTLYVVPVAFYQLSAWRGARTRARPTASTSPAAEVVS